jgi:hypothetical protein
MAELYLYIWTFLHQWWPVVAAGIYLGADEAARTWYPRVAAYLDKVPGFWRRRIATAVLVGTVFYAGFAAWHEEHELRVKAELVANQTRSPQRTFDDDTMVAAIAEKKFERPILIIAVRDPEVNGLARHIISVMKMASLNTIGSSDAGWAMPVDGTRDTRGIHVLVADANNLREDDRSIFYALRKSSLSPEYERITANWIIPLYSINTVLLIGYR